MLDHDDDSTILPACSSEERGSQLVTLRGLTINNCQRRDEPTKANSKYQVSLLSLGRRETNWPVCVYSLTVEWCLCERLWENGRAVLEYCDLHCNFC